MSNDKIRQWVQKKLEKGVDKKRIKKSLENTGHDPGLVEEVENSSNVGDNPFQQEEGSSEVHETESEQTGSEPEQDEDTREMELDFDSTDTDNEDKKARGSDDSGLGISVPSVPSFSINRKVLATFGASLLIVVAMAGVFSYVETSGVLEPQCSGDEGAGVKVYDVYTRDGETVAAVNAYEEVNVVLEVFDSDERIGQTVEQFESSGNRRNISVDAVGNRVSFHEYGCEDPSVERNY